MNVDRYRKSILTGIGAFLFAAQAAVSDGKLTLAEGIGIGIAVFTAIGVYRVPNAPAVDTRAPEHALVEITWDPAE